MVLRRCLCRLPYLMFAGRGPDFSVRLCDGSTPSWQVNDARDAIVVVTSAGIVSVVNQRFLKLFGIRKQARPCLPWRAPRPSSVLVDLVSTVCPSPRPQEDIVGKALTAIVPPQHDRFHDSCVDDVARAGPDAKVLGVPHALDGRSADGCGECLSTPSVACGDHTASAAYRMQWDFAAAALAMPDCRVAT